MITRRVFGKLMGAALVKIDSRIDGVTIGAQTYSFRDRSLDACIAGMKEVGLGEAELYEGHINPANAAELQAFRDHPPLEKMRDIRRRFDAAGIELYALNYSFRDDWTEAQIEGGFQIAKAMGVRYITASSNVSTAKRVDPLARKYKITVGFHNHSNMAPNEFARPADFAEAMRGQSRYIGINLDIGHFTAAGFDPVSFLDQHHDRIVTLHLKDRKKNQGPNLPFGQGDTNIKGVLQALKTKRYPIPANIEYEYEGGDTIAEMKRCFAYCKAALS